MARNTGIDSSIPAKSIGQENGWIAYTSTHDLLVQFICDYVWLLLVSDQTVWLNFICKKVLFLLKCQGYETLGCASAEHESQPKSLYHI